MNNNPISLLEQLAGSVAKFTQLPLDENGLPIPWDYDAETKSWTRDFVYNLKDPNDTLDFLASLQLTSVLIQDREVPVVQLTFALLDGEFPSSSLDALNASLEDWNERQLCVKWTIARDGDAATGILATSDNFVQSIADDYVETLFECVLEAVLEAHSDLVALTERLRAV